MRKVLLVLAVLSFVFFGICHGSARAEDNKWTRLVEESGKVIDEVQSMPDQGYPKTSSPDVPPSLYSHRRYRPVSS